MKRKKKGLTLVELMVVISLVGLVAAMVFSLINFGNKLFKKSTDEYKMQSTARLVAQKTNNSIKYATAVFAIPESSFKKVTQVGKDWLTDDWSYIGVVPVIIGKDAAGNDITGTRIVNYVWNSEKGDHDETVIHEAEENIKYYILFDKLTSYTEDKLLSIKIEASINGGSPMTIYSKVENLNALQVIDYGSDVDPATAIAYRSDERSVAKTKANIAMVLDESGSMAYDMGANDHDKRMDVLKAKASELILNFATANNVDVCPVPFSSSANKDNGDYVFYNALLKKQELLNEVKGMRAYGGTNTGDGMRRAYYALKKESQATMNLGLTPLNYMIILVDGETTYASGYKVFGNPNYYIGEGNTNNLIGNGSDSTQQVKGYDYTIAGMIKDNGNIKVYLIAMCSNISNVSAIGDKFGNALGGVYTAADAGELKTVFENIKEDIFKDLWFLDGPGL